MLKEQSYFLLEEFLSCLSGKDRKKSLPSRYYLRYSLCLSHQLLEADIDGSFSKQLTSFYAAVVGFDVEACTSLRLLLEKYLTLRVKNCYL